MLALNGAGLDSLGPVLDQMGRAWEADAAATHQPGGPKEAVREAGQ